ncbi:hypothetical protein HZB89_00780, partial [archaeon]|nr:hypothetical protein [archaeon]
MENERKKGIGLKGLLMALLLAVSVIALPVNAQATQGGQGSGLDFLGMGQKGGICSALTLGWGAASGPVGALGGMMCGLTFGQLGNNLITNTLGMGMMSYFLTKEKAKSELKGEESQSQEMTVNPITISSLIADSDFYAGAVSLNWSGEGQESIEVIAGQPQKIWKRKAVLGNPSNKEGLFDGVLKVSAVKTEFNTDYGTLDYGKRIYNSSVEGIPLSVKNAPSFEEEFHIRVKSLSPEKIIEPEAPRAVDCLSKYFKGKTGADATPKIRLDWKWSNLKAKNAAGSWLCDDGNVYCDAVQFNIEVMERLTELRTEMQTQLTCGKGDSINDCINNSLSTEKDALLKIVNFKAYLIKDGYSKDFQEDFDTYYRFTNFADTPDLYLNTQYGLLYKYEKDHELFRFVPAYDENLAGDYALESPGIYNVSIKIDFNYNGMNGLFLADGSPAATIKVVLDRF